MSRWRGKSATLIAASDMDGLAAHLRQLKSDATLNDAARERLLRETVLDLATLTPQSEIEDRDQITVRLSDEGLDH